MKYRIGDKVKVIAFNSSYTYEVGTIEIIASYDNDSRFLYRLRFLDRRASNFWEEEIRSITKLEQALL